MSRGYKEIDPAFEGAGGKAGLDIWCIENSRPVLVPRSSHGKFYSGSAYIILSTVLPRGAPPQHDIHYWLGDHADEVDSALASDKALELDAALGCCTVQYKEAQGEETEKFLSYFKPCIIPIEGKYSSKPGQTDEKYQISLLTCKGDHVVHVKEVPFSRSSLNHDDVFILDTASKIFLFCGCNSSIQERAKALEVVKYINDNRHGGRCDVVTLEDGKFTGDSHVGEFWALFGGYAPIPQEPSSSIKQQTGTSCAKLFWVTTQGKLCPVGTAPLNRDMLEKDKCYMLDCYNEVFVWLGGSTLITERKRSISAAEDFLRNEDRSAGTLLTLIREGSESPRFRSFFNNWPQPTEGKLYDEGRKKVAAIFKHQGYDVTELPEEECQAYINSRGTLKVWHVTSEETSLLPVPEQTKLFSGDCYVVQYTYSSDKRDEHLFYAWLGHESIQEDRVAATSHMGAIADSTKGHPVIAQVVQGKEPVQFFSIFQSLVIFKGGRSKRYRELMPENGIEDEDQAFASESLALFRVQGSSPYNMQAVQVNPASGSLNSSYCYILQSGASVFAWIGSLSSTANHDLLDRMLLHINPSWQPILVREGNEPDIFWNAIGGKGEYTREKEMRKLVEDPHLFKCVNITNDLKVKEIYNFVQDDLTTEDVLVLDCQNEIYVWVGRNSNLKLKKPALDLGLRFLEIDVLEEGLSAETPVYVVTEGYEPPFFTCFFAWDPSKANMHGNSFERKLVALKGSKPSTAASSKSSPGSFSRETTPQGLKMRYLSLSSSERSLSAGSSVEASNFNFSDEFGVKSSIAVARKLLSEFSTEEDHIGSGKVSPGNRGEVRLNSLTHKYEQLRVDSSDPVRGIDVTRREAYLSDEEFQEKFEMTKEAFYALPKWRQNKLKMSLHLF